jgi:eukaryotic-like serine/threonine-protein kinase
MARHIHGRYTIRGKLADGGMAEIFLAVQHGAEGFEKPVVLKRILTQYSADPQFRNMLLDEAHISMSLQHSNIVQVLDLGVAGGRYFLVLELVDGWDLERVLQRAVASGTVWPPALALYVTTQVCRALAYAHAKTRDGKPLGIIHRDISPNNVLISEQGEVKLADFGIAKAQRKREQTAAGVIKGKVAYMSPEQAMGTLLDKRSDVFSVGSMMYRMMTDKLPFEAGNDLDSLLRVQKAQFAPPEEAKPTIGDAVSGIIKRAMRLAPSARYQSADEMLGDIERVLRNQFQSAGQTELKLWLEQLGRRDSVESIGKRRLDTSGVVKDAVGTELSAGTSFELDDLEIIASGQTELAPATPAPGPPPLPGVRGDTTVDGQPAPPARRRFAGFWLGAVFALGAVLGIRYLAGWAEQRGVADRLGLGAGGATAAGPPRAPSEPPAAHPPAPAPTVAAPEPVPPPVAAAPVPAPAAVVPAPAPPEEKDAAGEGASAVAAAAASARGGSAGRDEEPDEEALLRTAVPNPESAVIGEEESESPTERTPPGKSSPSAKTSAHPTAAKPSEAPPPPATKPAKPTIVLHISTSPVGAVVRVRSHVLGRTPINLHFRSDNTYDILFVKSGYEPTTKRVALTGTKDRKLAVALKKQPPPKKRSFFHPHR